MKNKITRILTVFAASLVLMGGFTVPAFAQGTEQPPESDAINDSGVVVEETEDAPPPLPRRETQLL